MKLVTRQELANGAAAEWMESFYEDGKWSDAAPGLKVTVKGKIYHQLVALGDQPDPDQVDKVIGNTSWTHRECAGCEQDVGDFVVLQEYPVQRRTVAVCRACAELMVGLFADGEGENV